MEVNETTNKYVRRALSYLRAVARIESRFRSRTQYRQRLLSMAEGTSARPLDTVSGGTMTGRENILDRLTDLDLELAKELHCLHDVREQTWDLLSQLSHPNAGQLLEEFYLNGSPIQDISSKLGYSHRHIYRMKDESLQELGKLLMDSAIEDPQPMRFS